MVKVELSHSDVEGRHKSMTLDDYKAERLFLELSKGQINPALLNEGPYTLTNLSVRDEDGIIYNTVTFIP